MVIHYVCHAIHRMHKLSCISVCHVLETADEVAGKVERHITSYIAALEKHREILLASVKKRTENKLDTVRNQQRELEKVCFMTFI